jgi:hypothetical protein
LKEKENQMQFNYGVFDSNLNRFCDGALELNDDSLKIKEYEEDISEKISSTDSGFIERDQEIEGFRFYNTYSWSKVSGKKNMSSAIFVHSNDMCNVINSKHMTIIFSTTTKGIGQALPELFCRIAFATTTDTDKAENCKMLFSEFLHGNSDDKPTILASGLESWFRTTPGA